MRIVGSFNTSGMFENVSSESVEVIKDVIKARMGLTMYRSINKVSRKERKKSQDQEDENPNKKSARDSFNRLKKLFNKEK